MEEAEAVRRETAELLARARREAMEVAEQVRREQRAADIARNRTELERAADMLVSAVARDAAAGQYEARARKGQVADDPQARSSMAVWRLLRDTAAREAQAMYWREREARLAAHHLCELELEEVLRKEARLGARAAGSGAGAGRGGGGGGVADGGVAGRGAAGGGRAVDEATAGELLSLSLLEQQQQREQMYLRNYIDVRREAPQDAQRASTPPPPPPLPRGGRLDAQLPPQLPPPVGGTGPRPRPGTATANLSRPRPMAAGPASLARRSQLSPPSGGST